MARMKVVTAQLREVPAEYQTCRTISHSWRYTTVDRDGLIYVQGMQCTRCTTERFVRIHARTGELYGNRYRYAKGYTVHGGGLTTAERAAMRLHQVEANFAAQQADAPKARRKKTVASVPEGA